MRTSASVVLALLLVACGPKGDDSGNPDGTKPHTGDPPAATQLLAETPVVEAVDAVNNPLSFLLHVETLEPTTLELHWGERTLLWPASGTAATTHTVPLLGFHADSTTPVDVKVIAGSAEEQVTVDVVTPPLPDLFPRFELLAHDPSRMAPGYTVFTVKPGELAGPGVELDFIIAVDENAEVVWYLKPTEKMFDASIIEGGKLLTLAQPGNTGLGGPIVDSTLVGEELARYQGADSSGPGIAVYDLGFHHEALRLADGSTLTLSKEPIAAESYPTSYDDPSLVAPANISADVALTFDALGNRTGEWHFDWLPTTRIGYSGLEPTHFDGLLDWTHGNGADYDERDGSIIVSLRNQNAVIKMDAEGEPVWILGTHESWTPELQPLLLQPVGPVEWFYSQHAPMWSDDFEHVLLFDNGETRGTPGDGVVIPPDDQKYSRLVEYRIYEGTVEQSWEFRESVDGVLYSGVIGDADYLPNGNVLGCYGHVTYIDGIPPATSGVGKRIVRIIEIARDAPEASVFDLKIYSDGSELVGGWMSYRADRIADLY